MAAASQLFLGVSCGVLIWLIWNYQRIPATEVGDVQPRLSHTAETDELRELSVLSFTLKFSLFGCGKLKACLSKEKGTSPLAHEN